MSKSMMSAAGGGKVTVSGLEAGKILQGTTVTVKQGSKTVASVAGSIPSKAASTYTPKTTNQIIAAGQYLSGAQTIKGDENLVAKNILENVSIFGVIGGLKVLAICSKEGRSGTCTGMYWHTGLSTPVRDTATTYSFTINGTPILAVVAKQGTGTTFNICGKSVTAEGTTFVTSFGSTKTVSVTSGKNDNCIMVLLGV